MAVNPFPLDQEVLSARSVAVHTAAQLQHTLQESFGHAEFRSSQAEVIAHVLAGHDALVLMPTGMGKSLCYQLPALLMPGLTIVLSPLIALMKDQVDALTRQGIDAAYINSSLGRAERENRYRRLAAGDFRLLFVSPERFRKDDFRSAVAQRQVSLFAVDEAHCVSQWGHDFRPDYSDVGHFRKSLGSPPMIALTATATERVQEEIVQAMDSPQGVQIFNEGICRPNLNLSVREVLDDGEKFADILKLLGRASGNRIVYFNLIKSLDAFRNFLDHEGVRARVYHGKLPAAERRRSQRAFLDGQGGLMLATNAFGMGIDKANIRMILHAEIPDSVEAYYQEIGRAGRDGEPASCVLYYDQADLAVQMDFLRWRNPEAPFVSRVYQALRSAGPALPSMSYEDLQAAVVYKNRGDHRLETVLTQFERYHVIAPRDRGGLELEGGLPDALIDEERIAAKARADHERLAAMVSYVRNAACRRDHIHDYFGMRRVACDNCDLCAGE